jgi:WD40 repeat protein
VARVASTVREQATPAERAPDVFFSYSRKNRDVAYPLSEGLEEAGFKVWIDRDDIPDTADWRTRAEAGVEGAKAVLCLLTEEWAASRHCAFEADLAEDLHKRLVPVTVPPEVRPESLPPAVRDLSWIPLDHGVDDAALQRIRKALETDLAWRDQHARLLVRAGEWEARGEDKSSLLRGVELREAERWLEGPVPKGESVAPRHTAYILTSRRAVARRQRRLLLVVLAGLVVAVGLALVALWQREVARENQREADVQRRVAERNAHESRSRELAAVAAAQLRDDPELSLLLGVEAAKAAPTVQAEEVLRAALPRTNRAVVLRQPGMTDVATDDAGALAVTGADDGIGRIWDLRSGKSLAELRGHTTVQETDMLSGVTAVAMSPDGAFAATAGAEGDVRIWEPRTGRLLHRLEQPAGGLSNVAVSLAFASSVLLVAGDDGVVSAWDPAAGERVAERTLPGFSVQRLVLSPDRRRVAALALPELDGPGRVEVLDVEGLQPVARIAAFAFDAAFSPDGSRLATDGAGRFELWNDVSGSRERSFAGAEFGGGMAFSPDGRELAMARGDGFVRLVDAASGRERLALRHPGNVFWIDFDAEGTRLLTAGDDKTARLWDARSGQLLQTIRGHRSVIGHAEFLGDRILTRGGDGTARVWSPAVDAPRELRGHGAVITDVALADGGARLITTSEDGTARVWDRQSGRRLATVDHGETSLSTVAISPDGKTFATSGAESARLWRAADGRAIATVPGASGGGAAFSRDGRYLVTSSGLVWDVRRARVVRRLGEFLGLPVAVQRGRQQVVFGARFDAAPGLFAIPAGKRLARLGPRAPGQFATAVASADSSTLAVSAGDRVRLWSVGSGKEIGTLPDAAGLASDGAFSPDGSRLLTTSQRGVRIWDVDRRQPIADLPHARQVGSASFSRDGRFVVTASDDSRARIWEARTGRPIVRVPGRSERVTPEGFQPHALFAPDGRTVVAATGGRSVFLDPCTVCAPLGELVAQARRATTRQLSADERLTYLGG